jgi:hypothetical protein
MRRNEFDYEETVLAVKKGANWMDENYPGWALSINLSELDMSNCDSCIIGQAAMDAYWRITDNAASAAGYYEHPHEWADEHGFDAAYIYDPDKRLNVFRYLEDLWTDEVKKRLG